MKKNICPNCKSKNVAKILYGEPASSETLMKKVKEGKIYIGGCLIEMPAPKYHCNDCGKEWGELVNP